ncbi:MAG: hypothetical protein U0793_04930 [Gemmataceae bacterium]
MAIRFKCPHCNKALAVKDHLGGKKAACPVCKKAIVIPAATPVTSPADLEALAAAAFADDAAAAAVQAAEELSKQTIDFDCPYCSEAIQMPLAEAGKQGQCPECKHIIKIPVPEKTGPKDWRELAKKGPSAALINQPEQLDGAWGTEVKTKVGQGALAEAGALPEVVVEPIGIGGWLRRIFVVLVVGGVVTGLWLFVKHKTTIKGETDAIKETLAVIEAKNPKGGLLPSKLPPLQTAELYRALGELYIAKDERVNALTMFQKARAVIVDNVAEKDKDKDREAAKDRALKDDLDRDLFLADLCNSIVLMGGGDKEDIEKTRYLWTNEVQTELTRTLQALRTTDGKIIALRSLANVLFDKKQGDLAVTLANGLAGSDVRLQAQAAGLRLAYGKDAPSPKIPEDGGSINRETRFAQTEGLTRKGKLEEARKFAGYKGKDPATADRIEANVGAALILLDRAKGQENAKDALPFFEEALAAFKEARGATPWMTLELMRVGSLLGQDEQVKLLDKNLNAAFKYRAAFDRFLAKLARADAAVPLDAVQEIPPDPKLDKDGNAPALAWLAAARHNARLGASAELNAHLATLKDENNLKPFLRVGIALAARK